MTTLPAELLAEGFNLEELAGLNPPVRVGEKLELRLYTLNSPSVELLDRVQTELMKYGELLAPIEATVQTPSVWSIKFRVDNMSQPSSQIGVLWIVAIPAIVAFLGLTGVLGWGLFQYQQSVTQSFTTTLLWTALIGAGAYFVITALGKAKV